MADITANTAIAGSSYCPRTDKFWPVEQRLFGHASHTVHVDHKAETIDRVVEAVERHAATFGNDNLSFELASGPVGVMAAKNQAVKAAQVPMMLYVFAAVIVLCLISFRSVRATLVVVVPLYVVSILAQALMTGLQIGLTVSTLPVIALGVGIGVDYGIYILSSMNHRLKQGKALNKLTLLR